MGTQGPTQSRHRSKQDYQTPPEFLAAVRRKFQIDDFACDLAASHQNAVVPFYIDAASDSLRYDWEGIIGLSWCNPPYADIAPWVRHAWETSQRGAHLVMLLPAGVGSNW